MSTPYKEPTAATIKVALLLCCRLSSIRNNFFPGKSTTFSGLIRKICYGVVGTEYPRSGSNRSVEKMCFTCFNRAVIIRPERSRSLYKITERISARRANHGLFAECISALENVTEGSGFFRSVTERISARGKRHGMSRGGYPPLQNATGWCGLIEPFRKKKMLRGYILTPCTPLILTEVFQHTQQCMTPTDVARWCY